METIERNQWLENIKKHRKLDNLGESQIDDVISYFQLLEKIKKYRTQKNLSQDKMAEIIGISQAAYAKIESGYTQNITIDIGKGIAKALEISFNELFNIEIPEIGENLPAKIDQLEKRIIELEDQLSDKKELLKYYQESYTVTEKMIIILAEDIFSKKQTAKVSINVSELRSRAITELQKEYPDFFTLKPPFLLRRDTDHPSILFLE